MKQFSLVLIVAFSLIISTTTAQDASTVLGTWQQQDDESTSKVFFFKHEQKLYGLIYYYKDQKEEFSLKDELAKEGLTITDVKQLSSTDIFTHLKEFIWFKDFKLDEQIWEGTFYYPEEDDNYDTELKVLNARQLQVKFSYWGFSDKSVWERI